jgi:hypothetical protein
VIRVLFDLRDQRETRVIASRSGCRKSRTPGMSATTILIGYLPLDQRDDLFEIFLIGLIELIQFGTVDIQHTFYFSIRKERDDDLRS